MWSKYWRQKSELLIPIIFSFDIMVMNSEFKIMMFLKGCEGTTFWWWATCNMGECRMGFESC